MNEDLIRSMVREALARHVGAPPDPEASIAPASFRTHSSHYRYTLQKPGTACVIEPGVTCNHCGYCESHGH